MKFWCIDLVSKKYNYIMSRVSTNTHSNDAKCEAPYYFIVNVSNVIFSILLRLTSLQKNWLVPQRDIFLCNLLESCCSISLVQLSLCFLYIFHLFLWLLALGILSQSLGSPPSVVLSLALVALVRFCEPNSKKKSHLYDSLICSLHHKITWGLYA